MAARPWTPDDDARLAELHGAGQSLTACAKQMTRSRATVHKHAARLGLTWDRTRTADATRAKVADAKSRRADLRLALLGDVERLRAQLWKPAVVFNFGGKDNTYEERTLDRPPVADQLKLVQAVSTGVGAMERLERMDADSGLVEAVGMLDGIAAAIAAAADKMGDPEQAA